MEVINSLNEIANFNYKSSIAIGTFDGLHKGHQVLINKLINKSKFKKHKSIVYTFANHPREITDKNNFPKRIISTDDKIKLFKKMGIDILLLPEFDKFHRNIHAEDFVKSILIDKLNMKNIIIGFDFRFGKNAEGTIELLQNLSYKYNFDIDIVEPIKINNTIVSSTLVRQFILEGQIEKANNFLGWNYFIRGKVIKGKQLGTKFGFPTANILVDTGLCLPKSGVYITKTYVDDKTYFSVTNIGVTPTFQEKKYSIETYILNFNENIYNNEIKVEFYERIRNELKFDTIELLYEQIACDINYTKKYFKID